MVLNLISTNVELSVTMLSHENNQCALASAKWHKDQALNHQAYTHSQISNSTGHKLLVFINTPIYAIVLNTTYKC